MFFTSLISKLLKRKSAVKPHPYRYFQFIHNNAVNGVERIMVIEVTNDPQANTGNTYWSDSDIFFAKIWSLQDMLRNLNDPNPCGTKELTREEALKIIPNLP